MSSCLPVNVPSPEGGLLDELTLFVGFCLGKRDPGKNSSILFTGECTPENFRPTVVGGREMVADFLEDFIYLFTGECTPVNFVQILLVAGKWSLIFWKISSILFTGECTPENFVQMLCWCLGNGL